MQMLFIKFEFMITSTMDEQRDEAQTRNFFSIRCQPLSLSLVLCLSCLVVPFYLFL